MTWWLPCLLEVAFERLWKSWTICHQLALRLKALTSLRSARWTRALLPSRIAKTATAKHASQWLSRCELEFIQYDDDDDVDVESNVYFSWVARRFRAVASISNVLLPQTVTATAACRVSTYYFTALFTFSADWLFFLSRSKGWHFHCCAAWVAADPHCYRVLRVSKPS